MHDSDELTSSGGQLLNSGDSSKHILKNDEIFGDLPTKIIKIKPTNCINKPIHSKIKTPINKKHSSLPIRKRYTFAITIDFI